MLTRAIAHAVPWSGHLGSDSEVVMLEQGSEGMHGPCITSLNNGLTAESFPEQDAGAVALASQAQAMSRNVGQPLRREGQRAQTIDVARGFEEQFSPNDA